MPIIGQLVGDMLLVLGGMCLGAAIVGFCERWHIRGTNDMEPEAEQVIATVCGALAEIAGQLDREGFLSGKLSEFIVPVERPPGDLIVTVKLVQRRTYARILNLEGGR
jgi:hypothetical protein